MNFVYNVVRVIVVYMYHLRWIYSQYGKWHYFLSVCFCSKDSSLAWICIGFAKVRWLSVV